MNTETGQIYDGAQMNALFMAQKDLDRERTALDELHLSAADVRALDSGKIVPVSEQVVQKVRLGERELARRDRRRAKRRNGYTR